MQELLDKYKNKIRKHEKYESVKIENQDLKIWSIGQTGTIRHILWMMDEIPNLNKDKQDRWLGFIQGILFVYGYYNLEELREHVRNING